jgi:hypothetical protein
MNICREFISIEEGLDTMYLRYEQPTFIACSWVSSRKLTKDPSEGEHLLGVF